MKFKQYFLVPLLSLLLLFTACKSSGGTQSAEGLRHIRLERLSCEAACPTYYFWLQEDGQARYNGIDNVDKAGNFKGVLDKKLTKSLFAQFEKINFTGFEDAYTPEGAQIPKVVIEYDQKKIVCQHLKAPRDLEALIVDVDRTIGNIGWVEVVEE